MPNKIETWETFHKNTLTSVCHSNKRNLHLQKISIKDHKSQNMYNSKLCFYLKSQKNKSEVVVQ